MDTRLLHLMASNTTAPNASTAHNAQAAVGGRTARNSVSFACWQPTRWLPNMPRCCAGLRTAGHLSLAEAHRVANCLEPVCPGDARYACQPMCEKIQQLGAGFLFKAKPGGLKARHLYAHGSFPEEITTTRGTGTTRRIFTYKWLHDLPIPGGPAALHTLVACMAGERPPRPEHGHRQ